MIPRGLLARAAYHRAAADCDLEAARLALARGDHAAAQQHYVAARDAVLDIRYHRRDPELEALAEALGLTPPDWLHQADIPVEFPPDPPPKKRDQG